MSLKANKPLILFIVLWIHVSILDLFVVTYSGPVFLIAENTTVQALVTHLFIAVLGTGAFVFACRIREWRQNRSSGVSDKIWLVCSGMLLGSIIFLML